MQDCGKCCHFTKWKFDRFGGGLCEIKDARTKSDGGHKCTVFSAMKYDRLTTKREVVKEIALEFSEA